jgi:cytochrome c biogenesis protein CcdA
MSAEDWVNLCCLSLKIYHLNWHINRILSIPLPQHTVVIILSLITLSLLSTCHLPVIYLCSVLESSRSDVKKELELHLGTGAYGFCRQYVSRTLRRSRPK